MSPLNSPKTASDPNIPNKPNGYDDLENPYYWLALRVRNWGAREQAICTACAAADKRATPSRLAHLTHRIEVCDAVASELLKLAGGVK